MMQRSTRCAEDLDGRYYFLCTYREWGLAGAHGITVVRSWNGTPDDFGLVHLPHLDLS